MKNFINFILSFKEMLIISSVFVITVIVIIMQNNGVNTKIDGNSHIKEDLSALENGIIEIFKENGCDVIYNEKVNITCDDEFSIAWSSINANYLLGTISIIKPSFKSKQGSVDFGSFTLDLTLKQIYAIVDNLASDSPVALNSFEISFDDMKLENKSNSDSGIDKISIEEFNFVFDGRLDEQIFNNILNRNNLSNQLMNLNIKGENFNFIISDKFKNNFEAEIPLKLDDFNIENFNVDLKLDNENFSIENSNFDTNFFDANIDLNLEINNNYINQSRINNCVLVLSDTNDMIDKLIEFIELYMGNTFKRNRDGIVLEVSGSLDVPVLKGFENSF